MKKYYIKPVSAVLEPNLYVPFCGVVASVKDDSIVDEGTEDLIKSRDEESLTNEDTAWGNLW